MSEPSCQRVRDECDCRIERVAPSTFVALEYGASLNEPDTEMGPTGPREQLKGGGARSDEIFLELCKI